MPRLLLVRHGETALNAQGRFQGRIDAPLSDRGRLQAEALVRALARDEIHAVSSSDLRRARETAEAIATPRGLTIRDDPGLRELDFGTWDGLTYAEILARSPEALRLWEVDPAVTPPPGGETLDDLDRRARSSLDRLIVENPDRTVLVVAHAGPIRVMLCRALGLPPRSHWQFGVGPGSLSEVIHYPEGAVLARLNHLPSTPNDPERDHL